MKLDAARLRYILGAVILIAALGYQYLHGNSLSDSAARLDDAQRIATAFDEQTSDLWVESQGVVERTLKDDRDGSAHQRFVVRLGNDHTVLIAHNIDLAPRVPLMVGDRVAFRGEFEWNPSGGVVHWTHLDPAGRRDGGWIRHRDEVYR